MQDLAGKAAFVTGGASGIGFALGQAFADAGMKVMLADIEPAALDDAVARLQQSGAEACGVACDVADAAAVERAAAVCVAAFGKVHVLCNNAGVAGPGGVDTIALDTWRWVLDVNVMGVVHGVRAFLPHIRTHGEGGHIVNTASMAGLQSGGGFSPYSASKYAVVSMSEGLARQLAPLGVGVSVLCPSFVQTRIGESGRNRQARYGEAAPPLPDSQEHQVFAWISDQIRNGIDPSRVASRTLEAIRSNDLYVFTHPEWYWEVEDRFAAIEAAMARWAKP